MKFLILLLATAGLAGCARHTLERADAAYVTNYTEQNKPVSYSRTALTTAQIEHLRVWVSNHPTGWHWKIMDTPPALYVVLSFRGRITNGVNIERTAIKIGDSYRPLSRKDYDELTLIVLGVTNPPPGLE